MSVSVFCPLCFPPCTAGELHGQFDGGAGRAERQFRGGQEEAAEGNGHKDCAREQGSDAGQDSTGETTDSTARVVNVRPLALTLIFFDRIHCMHFSAEHTIYCA